MVMMFVRGVVSVVDRVLAVFLWYKSYRTKTTRTLKLLRCCYLAPPDLDFDGNGKIFSGHCLLMKRRTH
jgi:hypothetical protein